MRDKINSFRPVELEEYINGWKVICRNPQNFCQETTLPRAKELMDDIGKHLCINKLNFLNETIELKALQTPKLLINDNKKAYKNGSYPT